MESRLMKPLARSNDLVVEELGDELLVYDLETDDAHSLGSVAARVWKACDGRSDIDSIANELDLDRATVVDAITQLRTCQLFDEGPQHQITRRGLTLRAVKLGATAAAAPLIVSIAAPAAAMAVTEALCQSISVTGHGCGECHKFGCCCCEPPGTTNSSVTKPCHADCVTHPDCNIGTQPNCNGPTDNCKIQGG
jgi:Coenzyme PQQ synthesis protein D (PqqD)